MGKIPDTDQGHFAKVVTSNQCTISNTILEHNYLHLVSTLKVLKIKSVKVGCGVITKELPDSGKVFN